MAALITLMTSGVLNENLITLINLRLNFKLFYKKASEALKAVLGPEKTAALMAEYKASVLN